MKNTFILFFIFLSSSLFAQMWTGQDSLYGNEWIRYNQPYFKLTVAEDGVYKIPQAVLSAAVSDLASIKGDAFRLYRLGKEVPIYVSSEAQALGANDFIAFYGVKNRGELDRYLFEMPQNGQLNPEYSFYTDTSAYFLTWDLATTSTLRYQKTDNVLSNLPNKETACTVEVVKIFTDDAVKIPVESSEPVYGSEFGPVEGYATKWKPIETLQIAVNQPFIGSEKAQLSVRVGVREQQHQLQISLNNAVVKTENALASSINDYTFDVAATDLNAPISVKVENSLAINADFNQSAVPYLKLVYPHTFHFEDKAFFQFQISASNVIKYIEITNFKTNGDVVLYDLTNKTRLIAKYDATDKKVKIALPPSATDRKLCLFDNNEGMKSINSLEKTTFIDYKTKKAQYVILTHAAFLKDEKGNNPAQIYADYRGSADGGNYTTLVVDIAQLYDQFAYGVQRHALSVRNFGQFIQDKWKGETKNILILGRGLEYNHSRTAADLTLNSQKFFIPTFGYPPSDNLLLSENFSPIPVAGVGRLPVEKNSEIQAYLAKIKLYEAALKQPYTPENRQWIKRAMFFTGGATANEQQEFGNYMRTLAGSVRNNKIGANTEVYYKTSTDAVQVISSDEIYDKIKAGTSLLNFFGHSAIGGLDFTIDDPARFEIKDGRFPFITALGCYSGNIHHHQVRSIGERFVINEEKGAHSYWATSHFGIPWTLFQLSQIFYKTLGGEKYGATDGEVIRRTLQIAKPNAFGLYNTLLGQITLCGDPALKIPFNPEADYTPEVKSIQFTPSILTAQTKQYTLRFSVLNLGKNNGKDSLDLLISQQLPNLSLDTLLQKRVIAPGYADTLMLMLPLQGKKAVGQNRLFITLDGKNLLPESPYPIAEQNNELTNSAGERGISFFVIDNDVAPLYPPNFGIVGTSSVTLKANTSNPLALKQKYILQLDTTENFNSPSLLQTEMTQNGGIIAWKPSISLQNERVYYWRVSPDSLDNLGKSWQTSSFVALLGEASEGWNQSHYYQYKANNYKNLVLEADRKLYFTNALKNIRLKNLFANEPYQDIPEIDTSNNSLNYYWKHVPEHGVYIATFDKKTGLPKANPDPAYAWAVGNFAAYKQFGFTFDIFTAQGRQQTVDFLRDSVKTGDFVAFMFVDRKWQKPDLNDSNLLQDPTLMNDIYAILEKEGATKLSDLRQNGYKPYNFIYQKGVKSYAEKVATTIDEIIYADANIPIAKNQGQENSVVIGPAKTWTKALWKATKQNAADHFSYTVFGKNNVGNEVALFENSTANDLDLTSINAQQYPYLRLQYKAQDTIEKIPAQLEYWRVLYQGLPEFVPNANLKWTFRNDTLLQGEKLTLQFAVENASPTNGDSLLVKYRIQDEKNKEIIVQKRYNKIAQNGSILSDFELDTKNLVGRQRLTLELNPDNDQAERVLPNNFLIKDFFVARDQRNPLMDVTFDGLHILDNDIVSPKPNIMITVKDENPYFLLDSSNVRVFLYYPKEISPRRIYFDNVTLRFQAPSSGSDNKARIFFTPDAFKDGKYQLLVYAEDGSGNHSSTHILKDKTVGGSVAYNAKAVFQIVTKSAISNVLNYPNPFTTSTQFVYTLTGGDIPAYFSLQILTISGKIVRELTQDELGPLHIGTHRTNYAWDGTDQFGDKLAAGVYLYRLVAKTNDGKDFDHYDNEDADGYFKNGFGKMVILR
ncbi:MAG: hypothetical protein RLZZ292_1421 [Bacteroidota bacterium]|jgi:hypothetical protein